MRSFVLKLVPIEVRMNLCWAKFIYREALSSAIHVANGLGFEGFRVLNSSIVD
jgi:hypothetical protein